MFLYLKTEDLNGLQMLPKSQLCLAVLVFYPGMGGAGGRAEGRYLKITLKT